jgi:hypothetical protein
LECVRILDQMKEQDKPNLPTAKAEREPNAEGKTVEDPAMIAGMDDESVLSEPPDEDEPVRKKVKAEKDVGDHGQSDPVKADGSGMTLEEYEAMLDAEDFNEVEV